MFISLSQSPRLRRFAEGSAIGHKLSGRFVAGTQIEDVLRATRIVNQSSRSVSIDNLGENVS
ncbi:MAG: proline dehydrogenase, partial [Terriglobales bacterium]